MKNEKLKMIDNISKLFENIANKYGYHNSNIFLNINTKQLYEEILKELEIYFPYEKIDFIQNIDMNYTLSKD